MANKLKNINRTYLIVALCIFAFILTYVILRFTMLGYLKDIEKQQAIDAMVRCETALTNEMKRVKTLCHDWSMWDEAYKYTQEQNKEFIESNISQTVFDNCQLNLICFNDVNGKIFHSRSYDPEKNSFTEIKDVSGEKLKNDFLNLLRLPSLSSSASGIISTEKGFIFAASNPVLKSNGTGPAYGNIIIGRLIDDKLMDELSQQAGTSVQIIPYRREDEELAAGEIQIPYDNDIYRIKNLSTKFLQVKWPVKDINGKNAFNLSFKFKRDVTMRGEKNIYIAMIMFACLGILLILLHNSSYINYASTEHPFSRRNWKWRQAIIAGTVLVIGSSLSIFIYYIFEANEFSLKKMDFERNNAIPIIQKLSRSLNDLENYVQETSKFYEASQLVDRNEFKHFTSLAIERKNEIEAFEWAPLVPGDQRGTYEKNASLELGRNFSFTEKTSGDKIVLAEKRDEYLPIYYLEPYIGNELAEGLDLFSIPARKEVFERSRSSGKMIASLPVELIKKNEHQQGMLLLQPIYQKNKPVNSPEERHENIMGFVICVFSINEMMDPIISNTGYGREMFVQLALQNESGEEGLKLYSKGTNDYSEDGLVVASLDFGERKWKVSCYPTKYFFKNNPDNAPLYGMFVGFLVTILIALLVTGYIHRAVTEGEERYKLLFEEMLSGFALHEIICDKDGAPCDYKFIVVNQAFEKMTGLKQENIVGKTVLELLPNTEKSWIERYGKVALTREPEQFEDYSVEFDKFFEVRAFSPEHGKFATVFHDITEKRKSVQELETALVRSRYQQEVLSGIAVSDSLMQGEILPLVKHIMEFASKCSCADRISVWLFDEREEELRCVHLYEAKTGSHSHGAIHKRREFESEFPHLLASRHVDADSAITDPRTAGYVETYLKPLHILSMLDAVIRFSGKNHGILRFETTEKLHHWESDEISFACQLSDQIAIAILNRNKRQSEEQHHELERQLAQAQKIESIGRLAGGVAHDFNNMLTPILGYAELLKNELSENSPQRMPIDAIIHSAERAKDLTHQLLAFSRKQTLEIRPIDLNKVILGFDKLLSRTLSENIKIEKNLTSPLGIIEADARQIEQIIMNFAINAQDAMPDGGKLTIETAQIEIGMKAPNLRRENIVPGNYIMLAFHDTGIGMSDETINMIFEPFFTTKEAGKGTGLGLSTVYGIVRQHNAFIEVDSTLGKGSVFRVYFPISNKSGTEIKTAAKSTELPKGSGTVLVVEDSAQVRKLTTDILKSSGYTVFEAKDGRSAIEVFKSNIEQIDLLVTDIVMPDINGKELYSRLADMKPYLKVLYMSGYTADLLGKDGLLDDKINFIQKPFSVRDFINKVKETAGNTKC